MQEVNCPLGSHFGAHRSLRGGLAPNLHCHGAIVVRIPKSDDSLEALGTKNHDHSDRNEGKASGPDQRTGRNFFGRQAAGLAAGPAYWLSCPRKAPLGHDTVDTSM
jgi:hypothetical protein